jgi:hypothetical protein
MSTKTTLTLSVIAAIAVLAAAVTPALIQSASADAVPKTREETGCNDPKFADRESCPGKSEEAQGGDREDENICFARNEGQAKNCPPGSEVVIVNQQ